MQRVMKKPLLALPLISSSHKREAKTQNRIKSKNQTQMAQKQDVSQELLGETCLATLPAGLGTQEEGAQPCSWAEPGLPPTLLPEVSDQARGKATFPPLSGQENSNHKRQIIAPGSQLEPPSAHTALNQGFLVML